MARGGPRPNSGRKPKSPALKALSSHGQPTCPVTIGDPAAVAAPMIAPLHLSDLAQLHFRSIATMLEGENRASPHYAEHVALLALRLEQIQRYQAVLEMEGDTYSTESARKIDGNTIITRLVRARPEVAMLSDAMRQAQSLLAELMLSPAAALKIANGHKPADGGFDDF